MRLCSRGARPLGTLESEQVTICLHGSDTCTEARCRVTLISSKWTSMRRPIGLVNVEETQPLSGTVMERPSSSRNRDHHHLFKDKSSGPVTGHLYCFCKSRGTRKPRWVLLVFRGTGRTREPQMHLKAPMSTLP